MALKKGKAFRILQEEHLEKGEFSRLLCSACFQTRESPVSPGYFFCPDGLSEDLTLDPSAAASELCQRRNWWSVEEEEMGIACLGRVYR